LLLEGTDLHELLAQVRSAHGEAARIVRAERIRTGGVAGFFSKERYEVTVELPEDGEVLAPGVDTANLVEQAALAALRRQQELERAELSVQHRDAVEAPFQPLPGSRVALPAPAPTAPAPTAPAPAAPAPAAAPSLGDLLAAADASDGADRLGAMLSAGAAAPAHRAPAPSAPARSAAEEREEKMAAALAERAATAARREPAAAPRPRGYDQHVAERRLADDRFADHHVADQRVADQRVADERFADHHVADQRAADERFADHLVADHRVAEREVAERPADRPTDRRRHREAVHELPEETPMPAPHRPISTEGDNFAFALASMRRHLSDGTPSTAPNVTPVVPSVTQAPLGRHTGSRAARVTEDFVSPDQFGTSNGVASAHRPGERTYAENAEGYGEPRVATPVQRDERVPAGDRGYDGRPDAYEPPAAEADEREARRRPEGERYEADRYESDRYEADLYAGDRFDAPRERPLAREVADRRENEAPEPRSAYRDDVTTYSDRQAPRRSVSREQNDPADVLRLAREIEVPAPLRIGAGEIVIVVGEADAVVAASLLVADEVGSEAPVVLGRADVHRTVIAEELPARQEQARRWSAPLTVALPARPTGADAERAARLAASVGPAAVVVCVDATRRSHAVTGLLRALDAAGVPARRVAVHRAAESPDPLDVLSLDVPIGFLDGRPATSGAWAGLLLDATSEPGGSLGR